MPESIHHYNAAFFTALEQLNPAQAEAVGHIEGPVLVIAGPGTGKTHILAARIGKILMDTDAQPFNILCLTFTEAGVSAMRRRLLEFIGPEAHRVHIHTFHSFCNKIIRENLEYFGRQSLEPLTELERVELLQNLLDSLAFDHPLKQGRGFDPYFYLPHLADLFAKMKSEDWSVEMVRRQIDQYLADLPARAEYIYQKKSGKNQKGDLKQSRLADEKEKMERLRAAAELFPAYVRLMREKARYDYDDMILWVLRAFENNENLLRNYQEQYLYFLVDEFQDTNGAQNEIIQKLIVYWDSPNIFIVGDDDQSIYEFQGARLKNLTDYFFQFEKSLKLVILKENYRSTQAILDSSRRLIEQNDIRIIRHLEQAGIDKMLVARNQLFAAQKTLPHIIEYPYRLHELADIAGQIEALYAEGFPLEEVAVIYAEHKQSRGLIQLLEKKNIPYATRKKVNVLDLPFILQVRQILEYLLLENSRPFSGEHLLFRILHFHFLDNDPADISKIAFYLVKNQERKIDFWRELITDESFLKKQKLSKKENLLRSGKVFNELIAAVANLSAPHLIEQIFNLTGLLKWAAGQPEKAQWIAPLHTFMEFVKEETFKDPRLDSARLVDILNNMDQNRIPLELVQVTNAGAGVQLLTAHGSKGLEFQKVFLMDCVQDVWEAQSRKNQYTFKLPDTLTYTGEADYTEARRRLFYVAMTRAKEQLQISYARQSDDGKELQNNIFINELLQNAGLVVEQRAASSDQVTRLQTTLLQSNEKPVISSPDRAAVAALLEDFTMSISALNTYLDCPLGFYFEYILKVPKAPSEAALFGSAMHGALQGLFEKMLSDKQKRFPSKTEFLAFFQKEMERLAAWFSKKGFEYRFQSGTAYLDAFYETNNKHWHKKVKLEYKISNLEIDGVPLTGVIDKVELHEQGRAHIVDYKTGKVKEEKLRTPTSRNPQGGSYWRQLVFYKLLFENYKNTPYSAPTAEIIWLEPNNKGEFVSRIIEITESDTRLLKTMLRENYEKIMNQEFYEGCGAKDCSWCNFLRLQQPVASLYSSVEEELDDSL